MTATLAGAALLVGLHATAWYVVSRVRSRQDVADVAWGLGFVLVALYLALTGSRSPTAWLVEGLAIAWGLRLAWHIHRRGHGRGEDPRYAAWRAAWGKTFAWRSYLQVFVLQGALLLVVAAPLLVAATAPAGPLGGWALAGAALWIAGFVVQAVADAQLAAFVRTRTDRSRVMDRGLWRYSRHPNYFGEMLMWWGIGLAAWPVDGGAWGLLGPLTITLLLRYVSGVPMLEARYADHPGYRAYAARTSCIVPWWPRGKGLSD